MSARQSNGSMPAVTPVPVIFRKWVDGGEVIALFPTLPGTADINTCLCYQHIGQHGAADVSLSRVTVPATAREYIKLKRELRAIGYTVKTVTRNCRAYNEQRRQALREGVSV